MNRWILVTILAAAGAAGCGKGPSEDQCKRLLEHLVDLELKKGGASAGAELPKAELDKQKAEVIEAKSPEFLAACTDKTARDRVDCALVASDLEALAKCDEAN